MDNKIYPSLEEARMKVQFYLNKGLRTYIEMIGKGYKIVFDNCIGQEETLQTIHTCRQMLKGTKTTLDIISVE